MHTVNPSPLLTFALRADAAVGLLVAALHLALADLLARWMLLPPALLWGSGLALLAYIALLAVLLTQRRTSVPLLRLLIAGNLLWAAAAVGLALLLPAGPLGLAWLAVHALSVAGFALLDVWGLRQSLNRAPALPTMAAPHTASSTFRC